MRTSIAFFFFVFFFFGDRAPSICRRRVSVDRPTSSETKHAKTNSWLRTRRRRRRGRRRRRRRRASSGATIRHRKAENATPPRNEKIQRPANKQSGERPDNWREEEGGHWSGNHRQPLATIGNHWQPLATIGNHRQPSATIGNEDESRHNTHTQRERERERERERPRETDYHPPPHTTTCISSSLPFPHLADGRTLPRLRRGAVRSLPARRVMAAEQAGVGQLGGVVRQPQAHAPRRDAHPDAVASRQLHFAGEPDSDGKKKQTMLRIHEVHTSLPPFA